MSGQVVVALGGVDADLVVDHLPATARFIARPQPLDLGQAVGAIARAEVRVDAALLDQTPLLRVVARTGVGLDSVDVAEASRRGIAVVVTPGAGTNAVAEGTLAMILNLVKRLRVATECVAEGRWAERGTISMGDLEGATLGIVGYGRIGRRVGHLARAFGMTVLAHDPYLAVDDPDLVGLDELAARADVVTLHLPLTDETHHLVDVAFLARVRPGTILVNCGRGALLDLDASAAALEDGRLAGLGLDVFEREPPEPHPVFHRTDVVLSPHLMGLSVAATRATFAAAARGVTDVLEGRRPEALANPGWNPTPTHRSGVHG